MPVVHGDVGGHDPDVLRRDAPPPATGIVPAPPSVRRGADRLMSWVPLLAVVSYAIIAVIAQVRLDVLGSVF